MISSLDIESLAIPLPITSKIHQLADDFASQQPTPEKAELVLLNTIAVLVMNNYLTMLDVPTDLSNSDSWNPILRLCNDVADLELLGIGKLECRAVKEDRDCCYIPREVWDSRLGYVAVQIDKSLKEARILGFIEKVTTEEIALNSLRSPDALIDRIHDLKTSYRDRLSVNLSQWLGGVFETGWQTVNSIFNPEQLTPAFNFRNGERSDFQVTEENSITRAKLIDLGVQLKDCNLALLVKLIPEENGNIGVTLQVHSQQREICLPEFLELKVLESSDEVFMEAQARSRDNYIQLQFSGQPGETFKVEIILDEIKFTEHFQI